ncbi:hypothetical protein [Actinokineospora pegani]|uniref:hypothetical protein n=1 Tax=Actinokineospora pegani TaxID=2654637 RepID=UPI0012EA72F0|nr:hypothetical protein [Actinokineospora pegani]
MPGLHRGCGTRLGGQRDPGVRDSGVRQEAVRVRADVVDVLGSWCGLVVGERGTVGPGSPAVEDLVVFLDMNLAWLASHDAAGDFHAEVGELAEAGRLVVDHAARERDVLGCCQRPDCGQDVRAADPGERVVRCDGGHEWGPEAWLALSSKPRGGHRSRRRRAERKG